MAARSAVCALAATAAAAAFVLVADGVRAQTTSAPTTGPSTLAPLIPPPPPSEAEQVTRLMRERRLDDALARVDEFLAARPRDAQLRFLRGVILSDLGRAGDAVPVFEQLIADYPELPEPYNNLAVLIAAQGRYEQARNLLHQAITAQPNYVTAYENLGDLHVAMAIDAYQRASKLQPADAHLQGKLKLAREFGTQLRGARASN